MRMQRSIHIAAPPEKIWPFLVEPEKILKWCITFKKFEYTGDQHSGIDTPFYVEEKAGPMPLMKLNFKIREWVENERIAFSMTSGSGVKDYEQGWTIRAIPSGSTFTFMEDIELPFGIIGKLIGLVGKNMSKATAGQMLVILKSLAEA
jgi:uncharacterized protein YndB with AHSA1/START domain